MDNILKFFDIKNIYFPIIVIAIIILLYFLREVRCWYWKINIMVEEQKRQNELLEGILSLLEQINVDAEPEENQVEYEENHTEE